MITLSKTQVNLERTRRIENSRGVMSYMASDPRTTLTTLTRDNKDVLTRLFGKASKVIRGEFMYYFWFLEHNGTVIAVCTGKKGTSYEIEGDYSDEAVVSFLKEFTELIK